VAYLIGSYLEARPIGFVTGADGGYQVGDDRYLPDVGYMSRARQPVPSDEVYNSLPPDLAVEVVSPSDDMGDVLAKVNNYLLVGTAVWVVFPKKSEIGVFVPGQPAKSLSISDTLDGGKVLPGFEVAVQDVFGK
jgi:Uma2 family endonuclease